MDDTIMRVRCILAGVLFPAQRWELIAAADAYGADSRTRTQLESIPMARYRTLTDVVHAVRQLGSAQARAV